MNMRFQANPFTCLPGKPKIEPETHRSFQSEFYPGIEKATARFHSTEANKPKTMDFSNLPL
jgi:hypothetical protein